MSKKFEFTSELDHSVERVHAALTSEDFWNSRLAKSQTGAAELDARPGQGTLWVSVSDQMDSSVLPAIVRGVVRGPLVMERIDEWGVLDGGIAKGKLTGGAKGLPISIDAGSELRAGDAGGTVIAVTGEVNVKVPVVGGQIEGLILQFVENLVEGDRNELNDWLSEN